MTYVEEDNRTLKHICQYKEPKLNPVDGAINIQPTRGLDATDSLSEAVNNALAIENTQIANEASLHEFDFLA